MPELDYAILCDHVRIEGGVAHVIAGGIDTIIAAQVPGGQNLGFLARVLFSRSECGRPHGFELLFQGEDGDRLAQLQGVLEPNWDEGLAPGWKLGSPIGMNFGVPLPRYGLYSFEVLLNDSLVKSLPMRVVPIPGQAA